MQFRIGGGISTVGEPGELRIGWFRLATDLEPPGAPLRLGPGFDGGLERGAAIIPYAIPDGDDEYNAETADRSRTLNSDLWMTIGPNFRLVAPAKGPASFFLEWVGGVALDFRSSEEMAFFEEREMSVSSVEVDPYLGFTVGVQIRAPGQGEAGR